MKNKKEVTYKYYVSDFETSDDKILYKDETPRNTWVWAACTMSITAKKYKIDNSIENWFDTISNLEKPGADIVIYFHNLAYDGWYFMQKFIKEEQYKLTYGRGKIGENMYSELIDGVGKWYQIKFKINNRTFYIRDSMKLLPFSCAKIAKELGYKEKGEIDYALYRPLPYEITAAEEEYIKNDCLIICKALDELFIKNGYTKMTIGSNCLEEYKRMQPNFELLFPALDDYDDNIVRNSYRGGICWCNEIRKYIGHINIIDYNSMYPSVMHSSLGYKYPVGRGKRFWGNPYDDNNYDKNRPLFITHIKAVVEVKDNCLPFLTEKGWANTNNFIEAGAIDMYLNSVDLDLMIKNYDVIEIEYLEGISYQASCGAFDKYIDKWFKIKEISPKGSAMRLLAKLFLNNLGGKFGMKIENRNKHLICDDDGILKYSEPEFSTSKGIYIPVASFMTAYARKELIECFDKVGGIKNVLYMDTDSVHFCKIDIPDDIKIHKTALGCWDLEGEADMGIYIRQKTYCERMIRDLNDGETDRDLWEIRACGCPEKAKCNIKNPEKDFKIGLKVNGKYVPRQVNGGTVLFDTGFSIK